MSKWRRQALDAVPELQAEINSVPSVMGLWIELHSELEAAYGRSSVDDEKVARIYRLALLTLQESKDPDAVQAVLVAFFEHLPTNPAARHDMHRWVSPALFHQLEQHFRYFLSEDEFAVLSSEYGKCREAWLARS